MNNTYTLSPGLRSLRQMVEEKGNARRRRNKKKSRKNSEENKLCLSPPTNLLIGKLHVHTMLLQSVVKANW